MSLERSLGSVRLVQLGSTNPAKLAAATAALRPYAPDARVLGVAVDSGVAEQPLGFEAITRGAGNRARAALAEGGELGIGIEDGLVAVTCAADRHPSPDAPRPGAPVQEYFNLGCAVVTDGVRSGVGLSAGFGYPPGPTRAAVEDAEPIGAVFDALWRERRGGADALASGRGVGNIGKLTGGVLTREEYGRHAVLCALVRFLQPDLYDEAAGRSTTSGVAS